MSWGEPKGPTPSATPQWLINAVAAFSRKVIPLDLDEFGSYEEATTRWGMNPIYEAIPSEIRELAERQLHADTRAHFARLRSGWDGRR